MSQTKALHLLSLRCTLLSGAANGNCNNDYDDDDDDDHKDHYDSYDSEDDDNVNS